MANWWDDATTRMGDALLGGQQPWGAFLPPPTGRDRQSQIGMALLQLGGNIASADPRMPIMGALGQGVAQLQEQGAQRQQRQLQGLMIGSKLQEAQRKNQTMALLAKTPAPAGIDQTTWSALIQMEPAKAFELMIAAKQRSDMSDAYSGGGGGTGGGTPAGGYTPPTGKVISADYPYPVEYGYNMGNLTRTGIAWDGKGDAFPHPALKGRQFETFADPVQGVRANYKNVLAQVNEKGVRTFDQLGIALLGGDPSKGHITPVREDGGKDDSAAWGSAVAGRLGMKGSDPLPLNDPAKMALVMKSINITEHGRQTVPDEAYLAGVTAAQRTIQNQTAGTTQPNPVQPAAGAPQAPAGTPSPVTPVQAAQPPGAPPQAAARPPQGQPPAADPVASDPGLQLLEKSRQAAIRQAKISGKYDQVYSLDAAIAKRRAELIDQQRSGVELVPVLGQDGKTVTYVPRAQAGGAQTPDTERIRREQDAARRAAANQDVLVDDKGAMSVNKTKQEAEVARQAAQGENAARIQTQSRAGHELAGLMAKQFAELRAKATSASEDVTAIHTGRQILDSGVFTGLGANQGVILGRVGEFLGLQSDKAINAQVFGAAMAKRVLNSIGALGAQPTDADREYLADAQGGKITMNEAAIRRIFDIGEKYSRGVIDRFNKEGAEWQNTPEMPRLPGSTFSMPVPPVYADWAKSNPLTPLQRGPMQGQSQGGQPTGAGPPPAYIWDAQQKKLVPVK